MRGLGNLDSLGTEMSFSESARRGKIQKKLIFDLKIKKKCKPVTAAEQEFQQIVTKTKYLKISVLNSFSGKRYLSCDFILISISCFSYLNFG